MDPAFSYVSPDGLRLLPARQDRNVVSGFIHSERGAQAGEQPVVKVCLDAVQVLLHRKSNGQEAGPPVFPGNPRPRREQDHVPAAVRVLESACFLLLLGLPVELQDQVPGKRSPEG